MAFCLNANERNCGRSKGSTNRRFGLESESLLPFDIIAYCKLCIGKARSRRVCGLWDKRFRLFSPCQVKVLFLLKVYDLGHRIWVWDFPFHPISCFHLLFHLLCYLKFDFFYLVRISLYHILFVCH